MTRKIVLIAVVLGIVLIAGIQIFLAYGLTDSMRKLVLPTLKTRCQTDVSVNRVSVNLLGGSLNVHGIKVANPPGFDVPNMLSIDRCGLKVGLPALFKAGSADIRRAVVKDVVLTVIRNKEGALSLEPMLNAMQSQKNAGPATAEPGPSAGPQESGAKKRGLPNIIVKRMDVNSAFNYLDWQIGQPFKLGFEMNLELSNIANYGFDDSLSGVITLRGNVLENDKKTAFDLNGRISPITDPLLVSFDLDGSMQTMSLKTFKGLIENIGLQDGHVSGTLTLVCRKGQFDGDKSVFRLKFSDVVLTPEKAEKMRGIPLPQSFNVFVPVRGSLANPQINVTEAFLKTLTSEDMVNSIIKGLVDQRRPKDDEALKEGQKAAGSGDPSKKLSDVKGIFGDLLGGKDK